MAAFCVYSCGLLACHLCKYPQGEPQFFLSQIFETSRSDVEVQWIQPVVETGPKCSAQQSRSLKRASTFGPSQRAG
jgi:hypothetical protein